MDHFRNDPDAIREAYIRILKNLEVKRKIFVSFHHADQWYFDAFTHHFCNDWEILRDSSLGTDLVNSYDESYVKRVIREDYISGSSITIVLCGAETWRRKYVDAEIYYTLRYDHALLGILLPTVTQDRLGRKIVPDRLNDNIASGYAPYIDWTLDPVELKHAIELAIVAKSKRVKSNTRSRLWSNL